mmetsp:Transcript_59891/g.177556  ORF Transcript_59891/g.177556 Transcript_59891/m.177556 type:complete len:204 (-) Transcript_59891:895-1506(-)
MAHAAAATATASADRSSSASSFSPASTESSSAPRVDTTTTSSLTPASSSLLNTSALSAGSDDVTPYTHRTPLLPSFLPSSLAAKIWATTAPAASADLPVPSCPMRSMFCPFPRGANASTTADPVSIGSLMRAMSLTLGMGAKMARRWRFFPSALPSPLFEEDAAAVEPSLETVISLPRQSRTFPRRASDASTVAMESRTDASP